MPRHSRLVLVTVVCVCILSLAALAQSPPVADTYAIALQPDQNFGHSQTLLLGNETNAYFRFNLAGVPTTSTVSKATLRLYVDGFLVPGKFDVYEIDTSWNEFFLTWNNRPPLGASATGGHPVSITIANNTTFILVDITTLVQNWVNGTVANNGIGLALTTGFGAFSFDSKENQTTSHEPELEIELAGAQGPEGPPGPQGPEGPQGPMGPQGPQGDQGPAGTNGQGFTFRNAFDNGTNYGAYDVVTYSGSTYEATVAIPAGGGTPDMNPNWSLWAQVGAPGQQGAQGPQGNQGPQGQQGMQGPQGAQGPQGPLGPQGPQGDQGVPGTNGQGFTFRNAFDNGTNYGAYDVVTYSGSTYEATVAIPSGGGTPDMNPNWSLWAQVGAPGQQGTQGPQGNQGPQGPQGPLGPQGPQGPQGLPGDMNPGSPYYIQNGASQQTSASFNVDGSGTVGGTLTGTTAVNTNGTYQIGGQTVLQSPGNTNIFVGPAAGSNNTGLQNTLVGVAAGYFNTTGKFNTYVGYFAGCPGCPGAGSANIYIGPGTGPGVDESNTIRIGNQGGGNPQNAAYIAGIYGSSSPAGVPVFVNSNGQLGTGGGGGGLVTSFNGRTGAVVPAANDYSFSQLSGSLGFGQLTGVLGGSQLNGAYNLNVSFGNTGNSFTGNDLNVAFANVSHVLTAPIVNATGLYNLGGQSILSTSGSNTTTIVGIFAGGVVTGQSDTFLGFNAGTHTTSGFGNTFLGSAAGYYNVAGNNNTYLGTVSGCQDPNCFAAGSNNIYIGANAGTSGADESNTLRIGGSPGVSLGAAYISGIYGATSGSGVPVYINSSGLLGTQTSSLRFKEQVRDMGDSTSALLKLRPVTFLYKPEYDKGERTLQYGLIAEEVAKVYPELVAYGNDGKPYTVRYQYLASMLLNEVQKQYRRAETQAEVIKAQEQKISVQEQKIDELEQRLTRLEGLMMRTVAQK